MFDIYLRLLYYFISILGCLLSSKMSVDFLFTHEVVITNYLALPIVRHCSHDFHVD